MSLLSFSNRGVNLWAVKPLTIQLTAAVAVYTTGTGPSNISPNIVSMLDLYYSLLNAAGPGSNIDRMLIPMSETEYAEMPNKQVQAPPTMYWYQKLSPGSQQLTLWQVPNVGYPTAVISGYYLSRLQDASPTNGQTPDVPYLGLDALCAEMALRLATKFAPQRKQDLAADAKMAWEEFSDTDREDVNLTVLPSVTGNWGRMN